MVSSIGKTVFAAYAAIILTNVVVLALSARVNMFQDFFYVADKFPFILSIVTLAVALLLLVFDLGLSSAYTARAQFQIGVLALFSVFWLGFNAFSSSRWKHVPMNCSSIPSDYPDTRAWCHDLQALQAFVWLNWVLLSAAALATMRFSVRQHQKGSRTSGASRSRASRAPSPLGTGTGAGRRWT
ncbi:hypothetical protein EWM64_g5664 [Hericium alpestre]|uniref:MARVEL domain-containing protein n=1 Tax=Hericium alpestre TaxID=135208 RepID=A0A4Y9ZVY9_9AGAM|nr:hypothetical protein EWM64_g5664 [Hericium alpestre]